MASSDTRKTIENWQAILEEKQRAAAAERRRRAKAFLLAHLEAEYAATQNPMAIWAAWTLCRGDDDGFVVPLPEWVITYFDRFATTLRVWEGRGAPSDRLAEEVGNALGFAPGKKSQNPVVDWRERRQSEKWFYRFEHHANDGATPTAAIKKVAMEVNSTASTVRRRLNDFANGMGMTLGELLQARQQGSRSIDAIALEAIERMLRRVQPRGGEQPDAAAPSDDAR